MSLHQLARQVQSQGRGDDKMLVHMTPGEVKGLQALALAHGGSLSINPDTGLPEAGFLKNILPTVVGAGAMFIPGMQPIGAAMLGAGVGLATSGGNLKQGILGGLGAWGGASLVGGMMGAGTAALSGAESAALLGDAAIAGGETTAGMVGAANTGLPVGTQTLGGPVTAGGVGGGSAVGSAAATPSATASIQEGFKQAAANPGAYFKQNMFPIGAAVAPVLLGDSAQQTGISATQDQGQIRPYTYSQTRNPNAGLPGEAYFNQSYTAGTPYAAASGGLVALAEGGDVKGKFTDITPMTVAPSVNKYGTTRTVSPAVTEYNRILMDRAANEYVTQPPPLATLPGRGERANAADTSKIINEMYLKNLGRQADQSGLDYWTGQKMSGAMSLADVSKGISTSGEANIRNWYKQNYGRYATPEEIASVQQQYASGIAPETIIAGLQKQSPKYQEYMNAPITKANFDAAAYLAANPDIKRVSEYGADPYLHYEKHGKAEGREAPRLAYQSPSATTTPATDTQTGGFKYDAALQKFTGGLPQPQQQDLNGFFANISQDPNFQSWAQQNLYNQYLQSQQPQYAAGGLTQLAKGGIADLGGYSDGGRMLKGPGDGMSDSIPGVIGGRQPARLADGEFVVPADVVSHLGNGSTDAGAKKLYSMMDRVRKARTGKKKQAPQVKTERFLPA